MAEPKIPSDVKKMNFEEALEELEDIVRELESGQGELDKAINSYARGVALKQHCENKLKDAQTRIDKIVVSSDGTAEAEPADLD